MNTIVGMQEWNRSKPKTTVLAHGTFDLIHLGHIRHLQEARQMADRLIVSVTPDQFVHKGAGRPHFTQQQRMEALMALSCVDDVVSSEHPDAVAIIRSLKPNVYVKGIDYQDSDDLVLERERQAVEACGGRMAFTKAEKHSSSRLLNILKYPPEVSRYLETIRKKGWITSILDAFDAADKKNIVFVGELIDDEYRYVSALGKAAKEPILATVAVSQEQFDGGVLAAARHGEWFSAYSISNSHSITKTRFIDADFHHKLFEVYSTQNVALTDAERIVFQRSIKDICQRADIVIVLDFGHGLIGWDERQMLAKAKFLAVNAQSNAGNWGFNLITKYENAQFVCIDQQEAQLALGQRTGETVHLVAKLVDRVTCPRWLITQGRHGSTFVSVGVDDFANGVVPALATQPVDTMGAGDAVMAVTAPLVAVGLPLEQVAFVGNVVGAIKTLIIGHRRHVTRPEIVQTIEALLA